MNTEQIYSVVNGAAQQALGQTAIAAIDTASFVSLGNTVLSSQTNTEAFMNALCQRIGKTIISFREYRNKFRDMVLDDFEYGAILQKLKTSMPEAEEDESYDLVDGQSVDICHSYRFTLNRESPQAGKKAVRRSPPRRSSCAPPGSLRCRWRRCRRAAFWRYSPSAAPRCWMRWSGRTSSAV